MSQLALTSIHSLLRFNASKEVDDVPLIEYSIVEICKIFSLYDQSFSKLSILLSVAFLPPKSHLMNNYQDNEVNSTESFKKREEFYQNLMKPYPPALDVKYVLSLIHARSTDEVIELFHFASLKCNITFFEKFEFPRANLRELIHTACLVYELVAQSHAVYSKPNELCSEDHFNNLMLHAFKMFVHSLIILKESNSSFKLSISFDETNLFQIQFPMSELVECCLYVVSSFENNLELVKAVLETTLSLFKFAETEISHQSLSIFHSACMVKCYQVKLDMLGETETEETQNEWRTILDRLQDSIADSIKE